ncbi:MAG TPA: hypothetical protein VGP73_22260 [Thermoanaerobaculia bacterium]
MARLALLVAILALILSWAAYRRSGGQLKDVLTDATRGTDLHVGSAGDSGGEGGPATVLDRQADLLKAQARLLQHRAEVAGDRNLDQVERDVAEIRRSLERSYQSSGGTAKGRWEGLDADLDRLEAQLREKSSKALASLDAAISKIRDEASEEKKDGR